MPRTPRKGAHRTETSPRNPKPSKTVSAVLPFSSMNLPGVSEGDEEAKKLLKNPSVTINELLLVPGLVQAIQRSDDLISKFLTPKALLELLRILKTTTTRSIALMIRDIFQAYVDTLSPYLASSIEICEFVFALAEEGQSSFAFGIASSFTLQCFRMYPEEMAECLRLSQRMNELSLKNIEKLGMFQLLTDIVDDDRIDSSAFVWNCWLAFIGPEAAAAIKRPPACVYLDQSQMNLRLTSKQRNSVLKLLVKYLEGKPHKDIEAHVRNFICNQETITEDLLDLAIAIGEDPVIAEKVFELVPKGKHLAKAVEYLSKCVKHVSFDKFEFIVLKMLLNPDLTNISLTKLLFFVEAFLQNPENQVNEIPKIISYVWNNASDEHDMRKPALLRICTQLDHVSQLSPQFKDTVLSKWNRDEGLEESFRFPDQCVDEKYIGGLLQMFE